MVLTGDVWVELIELGVLDGQETCALCPERPLLLLDVARAPVLLCAEHARRVSAQLQADLSQLAARAPGPAPT
jgi:hypothetical protein